MREMIRVEPQDERWQLAIARDAAEMSEVAAEIVAQTIKARPDARISVPTGSTPLGMFDVLAARAARGEVDFSNVEVYCLDEYIGVTADDPNSLTAWLGEAFLDRVGVDPERVHTLPVTASDPVAAAAAYDADVVSRGGLDLAVLGLGPNGHIAYNEPGSAADSRTRVVTLTPESISQASAYWRDTVPIPKQAMTVGVGTLLESNRIVLLVSGTAKADILRRTVKERPGPEVPASWLRLADARLTVVADEAAAGKISLIRTR